jgi:acetoacetate decarboxylase
MPNMKLLPGVENDGVDYPPPPWRLHGTATFAMSLIDVAEARQYVPSDIEIVEIKKGRTLGGVGIVEYGEGSVFSYNELVIVTALARIDGQRGGWVSHIYVDSTRSQAGGQELFGLNKQLAAFTRTNTTRGVRHNVESDDGLILTATTPPAKWAPPVPFRGRAFGTVQGDRRSLGFTGVGRVRRSTPTLMIPDTAPFASLGLANPSLSVSGAAKIQAGCRIQILNTRPFS